VVCEGSWNKDFSIETRPHGKHLFFFPTLGLILECPQYIYQLWGLDCGQVDVPPPMESRPLPNLKVWRGNQ
jgi:hypothetical protein